MVPNRAKHHIISGMVHTLQLTSLKQFFAHLWTWIKIQKSKNLVLEVTKGNSGEYSGLRKNTLREKIPKYRVFFWSFFSRIQSKCVKIRTRKNSVFGHFSCSTADCWWKALYLRYMQEYWQRLWGEYLRIRSMLEKSPKHCVKSARIRSFILVRFFPYSAQIWKNTDQKKLSIWTFFM